MPSSETLTEAAGITAADCSTMAVLVAGVVGLVQLYTVCRPLNRLRAAVLALMAAAFSVSVAFLGQVFFLTVRSMSGTCWLWLAAQIAAALVFMRLVYLLTRNLVRRMQASAPQT